MKPTGATKELTGHSPLPWKLTRENAGCAVCAKNGVDSYGVRDAKDELVCVSEHDSFAPSRDDCEFIVTAVNERERLREIAKDALRFREEVNGRCDHDEAMTKLCTQCEIRAVLGDQRGEGE